MQKQVRHFVSRPIGGEFGISVSLPTLEDVVDYERERIQLTHGYPRFVPHQVVTDKERLARISTGMSFAVAFPSLRLAHFILNDFIQRYCPRRGFFALEVNALLYMNSLHTGRKSSRVVGDPNSLVLVEVDGVTVACLKQRRDYDRLKRLRRIWGAGFDVHRLSGVSVALPEGLDASLADVFSTLEGARSRGTLLFQSGMAAIAAVVLLAIYLKRRFVLIGNAYVDTDTIATHWPKEIGGFSCVRLPDDVSPEVLQAELENGPALVYFELPTNPNLSVVDLPRVASLADRYDALLAVDATIITPFNLRPLEHGADIVIHSTSKFLNGALDHLGGALSTASKTLLSMLADIQDALDVEMCPNQKAVLYRNLKGFSSRMATINESAREIAERLDASPAVARVFYPGFGSPAQEALAESLFTPGRSGVVSFLLADQRFEAQERFYNRVSPPIMKGPGLGGETTLLCPYVMLAHFQDDRTALDARGLDFHLMRLSVGTEPVADIWRALYLEE